MFVSLYGNKMNWMDKFKVIFLTEAREFLIELDEKKSRQDNFQYR